MTLMLCPAMYNKSNAPAAFPQSSVLLATGQTHRRQNSLSFKTIQTIIKHCWHYTLLHIFLRNSWLMLCTFAKNVRCSWTVRVSNKTSCWGQSPRFLRMFTMSRRRSSPLMYAVPELGGRNPAQSPVIALWNENITKVKRKLLRNFWREINNVYIHTEHLTDVMLKSLTNSFIFLAVFTVHYYWRNFG